MSELAAKRDDARLGGLSARVRGIADGAARYLDVEVRHTAGLALPPCPDEWLNTTLGSLGEFSTSSVDKKSDGSELPIRLVNYMDVYRHRFITDSMPLMVVTATRAEIAKSQLLRGDLLFTPSSETPDDIGHSAVVISNLPDALHSYHTVRLRFAADDEVDVRFAGRFANGAHTRKHFEVNATGSTRYTLSLGDFRSAPVRLPPIPEQKKISEVLDTLDATIRQTEAIIAKLKQVKQGLLHDLLTRGIDANGELRPPHSEAPHLYKPSPLGWIPKEWCAKVLDQLVDQRRPIVYGILMPGQGYEGGVPVVKVKDIVGGSIRLDQLLLTSPAIDREYKRSRLAHGDLLFTIRGSVGRTAFVPPQLEAANITQDTARIGISGLDARFVREYLAMPVPGRFITTHTLGVAVQGINLGDVRRIPISVPQAREAEQIADILEANDKRMSEEKLRAEKLSLAKSGLMDDLLTGRVRVAPLLEAATTP